MKISEPNFWWVSRPLFILRLVIPGWNLFISLIIIIKNFFIKEYTPSVPTICVGNFVIGGQGKTPFVRYIREILQKRGVKTCVVLKGYGGKSKLTKIIDINDKSENFGDESILHSIDGLTIVSKKRSVTDISIRINKENLRFIPFAKKAERIAIPTSSRLVSIILF